MKKLLILFLFIGTAACSKTPAADTAPGADTKQSVCVELATKCHEHAEHSAKAKECHELGHSKEATEAECQARRAECLDACTMAEGDHKSAEPSGTNDEHEGHHEH